NAYIPGLPPAESETLLDALWAHATKDELTWYQQWRAGDLILWDNRSVMHRRDAFDPTARRVSHGARINGDQPFAPGAAGPDIAILDCHPGAGPDSLISRCIARWVGSGLRRDGGFGVKRGISADARLLHIDAAVACWLRGVRLEAEGLGVLDPQRSLLGPGQCRAGPHQERRLRRPRRRLYLQPRTGHAQEQDPVYRGAERRRRLLAARPQPEGSAARRLVRLDPRHLVP